MKKSIGLKSCQWLLIMLCIIVFFPRCSTDELIEKTSEPEHTVSKVERNSNASARGGIDPGIDDVVFDGWVKAYMITGVEDFCDKSQRADAKQLIIDLLNTFIVNEINAPAFMELRWLENGYYTLSFAHSGKVLDVRSGSTAESADVIQYGYHGGYSEQWQLVRL